MAGLVPPRLEVVGHRDGVEPDLFRELREPEQLARCELLGRSLVAELDHEARRSFSSFGSTGRS